jgi:hypothetical protein
LTKLKFILLTIGLIFSIHGFGKIHEENERITIDFFGKIYKLDIKKDPINLILQDLQNNKTKDFNHILLELKPTSLIIQALQKELQLPDWLSYQLIRRIAEQINSKYEDYTQYTLTKYLLLTAVGFEPIVFSSNEKILLYVKSSDTIFNLPYKMMSGAQYVCLNYHDYDFKINFDIERFYKRFEWLDHQGKDFHYTIQYLPSFQKDSYKEKNINFTYKHRTENYTALINTEMQDYFTNYPVTEYRYQFTIPFSEISYNALVPKLKSRVKEMPIEDGVEYLMIFVRDGFEFETDTKLFGREKRLSAEETLAYNSSDCEDRSALFFLLVKEIYNLPMAIIAYPEHVNVGVQLPKKKGISITIDNQMFTICEPTPQKKKRGIGWMPKEIRRQPFEIAYTYKQ